MPEFFTVAGGGALYGVGEITTARESAATRLIECGYAAYVGGG